MNQPPLNLRQIAAIAGVSASTVSRALRNDTEVSSETSLRLRKLAEKLGYTPNPLVSSLMASRVRLRKTSQQQVIAYLNAFQKREAWRGFTSVIDYFEGAKERANQCGYQLEEFWLREHRMNSKRMSEILFHRGIHGVLLAPLPRQMGHMSLEWEHFSAAALGYTITRPFMHRAVPDHLSGIRTALRNLHKLGYRRIGFVMDRSQDRRSNDAWSAGYGEYALFRRPNERVKPFLYTHYSQAYPKFRRWLEVERPEAIVSGNNLVLEWMNNFGLRTPDDFGFVILDRSLRGSNCTGIYINGHAIGMAAVDLVIGQLNRNERGLPEMPKTTMIRGQWIDGETVRPLKD